MPHAASWRGTRGRSPTALLHARLHARLHAWLAKLCACLTRLIPDLLLRLKLDLHKFVDDVGEVVDRATKEDKMEQTLSKLQANCRTCQTGLKLVSNLSLTWAISPARLTFRLMHV